MRPKVPFFWRRRLHNNPEVWAGPALRALGDTISLPLPNSEAQVVISSAPVVRDLFHTDLLAGRDPLSPLWGLSNGRALASSRRVVRALLEPLLGARARTLLAGETARVARLIQTSQHRDLDLLRMCRSVYYRTVLQTLVGVEGGPLQRGALLCDAIAGSPTNVLTGEPAPRAYAAAEQLRAELRASLVDSEGVVPKLYRQVVAGQVSGAGCRDLAPETYFEAVLSSILISVEPVARAAASTLDYCLRNSLDKPSEEFQGCIRRDPPIPFFVRTVTSERPVPLPNPPEMGREPRQHVLRRGDRVLLHLPTMFETDPHAPFQDAFGLGGHRCGGSAIGVAYLRATLDPMFRALCLMMPKAGRKPLHATLDLAAADQVFPHRRRRQAGLRG